jgi:hypothetical protein
VDATPDVDDVFYNKSWHTWLVGGLGAGGAAVYMLDVTDALTGPSSFSEANASSIVMGDWSSANIGCASDTTTVKCSANMGNTYGTPIVRRLHDGKWAVIFGNGFGSPSGDAGIFIMLIDSLGGTQASNTYYLSTGKAGTNDGIASVSSADLDGDHITDYVYAGDLLGNVWRFDLTSASEGSWAASSTPLFSTAAGQPITTKVQVIGVPQGAGPQRLMIDFGTGQKFPPTTLNPTTYNKGTQYLYGVWDWNMANWNSMSSTKYLSAASGSTLAASNLTTQTLTPIRVRGCPAGRPGTGGIQSVDLSECDDRQYHHPGDQFAKTLHGVSRDGLYHCNILAQWRLAQHSQTKLLLEYWGLRRGGGSDEWNGYALRRASRRKHLHPDAIPRRCELLISCRRDAADGGAHQLRYRHQDLRG